MIRIEFLRDNCSVIASLTMYSMFFFPIAKSANKSCSLLWARRYCTIQCENVQSINWMFCRMPSSTKFEWETMLSWNSLAKEFFFNYSKIAFLFAKIVQIKFNTKYLNVKRKSNINHTIVSILGLVLFDKYVFVIW